MGSVCFRQTRIFGWDSLAAPPELQGSGTSAMQKSIYSHGVTGRERGRQRDIDRQRDRGMKGDRERKDEIETMNEKRDC